MWVPSADPLEALVQVVDPLGGYLGLRRGMEDEDEAHGLGGECVGGVLVFFGLYGFAFWRIVGGVMNIVRRGLMVSGRKTSCVSMNISGTAMTSHPNPNLFHPIHHYVHASDMSHTTQHPHHAKISTLAYNFFWTQYANYCGLGGVVG